MESIVAVERALAVDRNGTHVEWDAPEPSSGAALTWSRSTGQEATVLDWKSGWVSEDEEGLRVAWAPGLYAALLWAWAPRLEEVAIKYHYLRTGQVVRIALTRADAAETLGAARVLAAKIACALETPDDPEAFPPRPSRGAAGRLSASGDPGRGRPGPGDARANGSERPDRQALPRGASPSLRTGPPAVERGHARTRCSTWISRA